MPFAFAELAFDDAEGRVAAEAPAGSWHSSQTEARRELLTDAQKRVHKLSLMRCAT